MSTGVSIALHLLKCPLTHFTAMHDTVKMALISRLRSLMPAQLAAVSVLAEKPVKNFYELKDPLHPEGIVRRADVILLLSGTTQQDVFIVDVVSVCCRTPNGRDGFYFDLNRAEAAKRYDYSKYAIPAHHFFPLAFGRTNILARDTLRFCEVVGCYFPKALRVEDKLKATLSRAIASGVAATFNKVLRRIQLAEANRLAFSLIPPVPEYLLQRSKSSSKQPVPLHAPLSRIPTASLDAWFSSIIAAPLSRPAVGRGSRLVDRELSSGLCDSNP